MGGLMAMTKGQTAAPPAMTHVPDSVANAETDRVRTQSQTDQWLAFLGGHGIHPKLSVSNPGDADEREADAVADRVLRMPAGEVGKFAISTLGSGTIRRACCAGCGPEEDSRQLQRRAESGASVAHGDARDAADAVSGGGRPLGNSERRFFEPRFGRDLSAVRIHTGTEAARAATGIGALAYTHGQNIAFAAGQYRPEAADGRRLLAHELAHVMQQHVSNAAIHRQAEDDPETLIAEAEDVDSEEGDGEGGAEDLDLASDDVFAAKGEAGKKGAKKGGKKGGGTVCSAGGCPQGKQKKVIHNDCGDSDAVNKDKFITNLDVKIGAGELTVTWSDKTVEKWSCTANASETPKTTSEVVGTKCSKEHTNLKKDGMAWFTGFRSEGKRIGFHNSQPVGPGLKSHGCVRVCCDKAEIINKNTSSDVTKITVAK